MFIVMIEIVSMIYRNLAEKNLQLFPKDPEGRVGGLEVQI